MSSIGQLILTGISGTSLTEEEKKFIESENISGVILFKRNFESPAQLAELINNIQVLREEYPLFIATDHEGGRVLRFKSGFTQFPAMLDIAKINSPKLCFEVHKIMAQELKSCGINLNLAPVCDILSTKEGDCIGDRAFGHDEENVSKFVTSAIRGLQTNGMLACAKHFPGHGQTSKDSHLDLPIVKTDLETLKARDMAPFVKAVKARVEFLMMAHLVVDSIDSDLPCSLSKKAHQIVRDELKFSKIIISDDMTMGAITKHFSYEEAAVMAIAAGSDLIEYKDMADAQKGLEGLKKAIKDRKIRPEDLSKKYERVKSCKKTYLSEYKPVYIPSIAKELNSKEAQQLLKDIQEKIASPESVAVS